MFVSAGTGQYPARLKMGTKSEGASALRGTGENTLASGRMVRTAEVNPETGSDFSQVSSGGQWTRLALMLTPASRGSFSEQAAEVLARMREAIEGQPVRMRVTTQTVFLRDPEDQVKFDRLLDHLFDGQRPLTTYIYQGPCDGAALALEAWAVGGSGVVVENPGAHVVAVSYDDVRWVSCGDISAGPPSGGVYAQTLEVLKGMNDALAEAGSGLQNAVRTWFYLGGITNPEGETERYKELNRARSDFYQNIHFHAALLQPNMARGIYPASTGIGMQGLGLSAGCLALESARKDLELLPLENPQQTPAYAYHPRYSPQSPKFSRAMALVLGNYVTTWVSGTASIVDSESQYLGDALRQTEQTMDNIEKLIASENLTLHGVKGAGARLGDMAKIRVYVKRAEDFNAVRSVCQRRLPSVPAVYAVADVCRPELLVEIEGVAFSRRMTS